MFFAVFICKNSLYRFKIAFMTQKTQQCMHAVSWAKRWYPKQGGFITLFRQYLIINASIPTYYHASQ